MDSYGRMAEILVAVLILFLCPLLYFAQKQDIILQTCVTEETAGLVELARTQGSISEQDYRIFERKLAATGMIYEVEMRHYSRVWDVAQEPVSIETVTGKEEIMKILEKDGVYYFRQGDFLLVKVRSLSRTMAGQLTESVTGNYPGPDIVTVYGGGIRNETG